MLRDLPPDIGPEFLHDEGNRVITNLRAPHAGGIAQGPVAGPILRIAELIESTECPAGMVAVSRNGRSQCTAKDLRHIELLVAGIASCNQNAAHRITRPVHEAAFAGLE